MEKSRKMRAHTPDRCHSRSWTRMIMACRGISFWSWYPPLLPPRHAGPDPGCPQNHLQHPPRLWRVGLNPGNVSAGHHSQHFARRVQRPSELAEPRQHQENLLPQPLQHEPRPRRHNLVPWPRRRSPKLHSSGLHDGALPSVQTARSQGPQSSLGHT